MRRSIPNKLLIALSLGIGLSAMAGWAAFLTVDAKSGRVELGQTVLEPGQSWWFRAHHGVASSRFESWIGPSDPAMTGLPTADVPAPSWQKLNGTPDLSTAGRVRVVELWGWPIRAVWREGPDGGNSMSSLPWRPFWPGFAVDAILYGIAAWAVMLVAQRVSQRRRT